MQGLECFRPLCGFGYPVGLDKLSFTVNGLIFLDTKKLLD
jgi:hypothetical protein